MYSNLTVNNNLNFLKLHYVVYLIKYIDDARSHKYKIKWKFTFGRLCVSQKQDTWHEVYSTAVMGHFSLKTVLQYLLCV